MRELIVGTFNIRSGWGRDPGHYWPQRRQYLVAAVESLQADLLGLQEAHGFQRSFLRRRLGGYASVGRPRGHWRGEACPILYGRRLKLQEASTRWLSPTPEKRGSRGWGSKLPRIATLAWFELDGVPFGVANTHLDPFSAHSRERSAELLLRWLDPSLPWIVLGDLNETPSGPSLALLVEAGFSDPLAGVEEGQTGRGTYHGFSTSTEGDRIDFVLVRGPWEVLEAEVLRVEAARRASDHWPVRARLRLPEGGREPV